MAEKDATKNDILELAPETRLPEEEPADGGFLRKLKRGLFMTHTELLDKVGAALRGKTELDPATLDYLEEILIGADLGVETALDLVERVRKNALKEQVSSPERLRKLLSDEIAELLRDTPVPRRPGRGPVVSRVVGVNGVG